jgi:hypothetical protein
MDTALINNAKTVQLIGLAILAIMVIILGARIAGTGSRGFSSLIMEIAGLLVAVWIIARPNDVTGLLLKSVGGIQTPAMPSGGTGTPPQPAAFIVTDAT